MGFVQRLSVFLKFALGSVGVALRAYGRFRDDNPITAGIPGIVARWLKGKPFVFESGIFGRNCPKRWA